MGWLLYGLPGPSKRPVLAISAVVVEPDYPTPIMVMLVADGCEVERVNAI